MITVGWTSLVRLFRCVGVRVVRPGLRGPRRRKTAPALESLESISLLSGGARLGAAALLHPGARAHHLDAPIAGAHRTHDRGLAVESTPQTLPIQTATLPTTLTNFTDLPMSSALNLFDPTLGTLLSVTVTQTALLQSNISVQNLNFTSSAVITDRKSVV